MSAYHDVTLLARAGLVGLALFGSGWWARGAVETATATTVTLRGADGAQYQAPLSAVAVAACIGLGQAIDAWYADPERRGAPVPQAWADASAALGGCY